MRSLLHRNERTVDTSPRGPALVLIAAAAGTAVILAVAIGPLEELAHWPIFGILASAQTRGRGDLPTTGSTRIAFGSVDAPPAFARIDESGAATHPEESWQADDCADGTRPDFAH